MFLVALGPNYNIVVLVRLQQGRLALVQGREVSLLGLYVQTALGPVHRVGQVGVLHDRFLVPKLGRSLEIISRVIDALGLRVLEESLAHLDVGVALPLQVVHGGVVDGDGVVLEAAAPVDGEVRGVLRVQIFLIFGLLNELPTDRHFLELPVHK